MSPPAYNLRIYKNITLQPASRNFFITPKTNMILCMSTLGRIFKPNPTIEMKK